MASFNGSPGLVHSCESNLEGFEEQIEAVLEPLISSEDVCPSLAATDEDFEFTSETVLVRGSELTPDQRDAFEYLKRIKANELFSFMMGHILTKVPDDPYGFLIELLEKCLEFRDSDGEPPLLFDPPHQEIVYRGMDPGDTGEISYKQYCNGMKTMGVKEYNRSPPRTADNKITRKDFLEEADKNLIDSLWEILSFNRESKDEADIKVIVEESVSSSEFSLEGIASSVMFKN